MNRLQEIDEREHSSALDELRMNVSEAMTATMTCAFVFERIPSMVTPCSLHPALIPEYSDLLFKTRDNCLLITYRRHTTRFRIATVVF